MTNNLEVIKENVEMRLAWLTHTMKPQETEMLINCVLNMIKESHLLQADEDIEVKEKPTCKNCDAISIDWFMSRAAYTGIAPKCNDHKKPTKETKLRDFKKAFKSGERDVYPHRYEIVELLNILLEEES